MSNHFAQAAPKLRGSGRTRRIPVTICVALMSLVGITLGVGCQSTKEKQLAAFYGPTESLLEVVAVLRRHIPDDTYRFPPATDFTGRNVYRSTLLRLENLESIHEKALRSGYLSDVITFSKGRALERLRGYDLASTHYREVESSGGMLSEDAVRAAAVCDELASVIQIGIDLVDPLGVGADEGALPDDDAATLADLDERSRRLVLMLERSEGTHYAFVIREELERVDFTRAQYMVGLRFILPGGQLRALSALQQAMARNSPSKNRRRHMVNLANFYAELAEEYVEAVPPTSLEFDPPRFQELVDSATQLYRAVASQDGTTEKLEASRRLEAFLAFALTVDRDRFTQ